MCCEYHRSRPRRACATACPGTKATKSANIVKIDAVKSIKPRPWKREHYGVRRDIHEEMVSRCGGTRASRQALDLAIHLLRYEKEHRSQMDKAERDEKQRKGRTTGTKKIAEGSPPGKREGQGPVHGELDEPRATTPGRRLDKRKATGDDGT